MLSSLSRDVEGNVGLGSHSAVASASPGVHVTIPGQSTLVKAVAKIATNSGLQALTVSPLSVVTVVVAAVVVVVAADLRVGGGDQHPGVEDHVADVARAG